MGIEDWHSRLDTISTPTVLKEGGLTSEQREVFLKDATDFLRTNWDTDRDSCRDFILACANSTPETKRDFELAQNYFYNSIKSDIVSAKTNKKSEVKPVPNTESVPTNQPSNKATETKEREKISEKLELADFAYVDLKRNEKTWTYEVSDIEKMNKYVYTKAKELLRTLDNPVSVAKIEQKLKYPNEKVDLDENELSALNCVKDDMVVWSQYADTSLDTNWNTVISDLDAKFSLPSPMSVLIKTKNELASILETVVNIPWNVIDWTVWTLKNVWFWLEKKFKWFFNDSKAIDKAKLTEFSKKWLTVISQEQDSSSWFSVTLLRDTNTNELTLWIRWTDDLTDMIYSNLRLSDSKAKKIFDMTDWMPKQMVSLVNYIENNPEIKKVRESKWQINVVGHSLWWAVAELLKAMYPWLVKETHTFNAPWIKQITPKLNPADRMELEKAKKFGLIKQIDSTLSTYPNNLKTADFSKVLNIRNHDWIWSVWDSVECWWHIWVTTDKIPWDLHFLDWIRDNLDGLSTIDFDRMILNKRDYHRTERESK